MRSFSVIRSLRFLVDCSVVSAGACAASPPRSTQSPQRDDCLKYVRVDAREKALLPVIIGSAVPQDPQPLNDRFVLT